MINSSDSQFDIGTIIDFNPNYFCADVILSDGKTLSGVTMLGLYGPSFGQDLTWIHNLRGANVVLALLGSEYFIVGTMPPRQVEKKDEHSVPVTEPGYGGSEEKTYGKAKLHDHAVGRDTTFFNGDKILRTETDTEMSLWREGIAKLKAGPLSQFILGKFKDFGRLITRIFQFYSDFGEVKAEHSSDGRVSLNVKGGADFAEETHPSSEKWTIQVWMGDKPGEDDSRLYVRVNDKDNAEYVTLKYDIKGNQTVKTSNDDKQTIGNDRTHNILNNEAINVTKNAARNVVGNWDINVGGVANFFSDTAINMQAPLINISSLNTNMKMGSSSISITSGSDIKIESSDVDLVSDGDVGIESATTTVNSTSSIDMQAPAINQVEG